MIINMWNLKKIDMKELTKNRNRLKKISKTNLGIPKEKSIGGGGIN